MDSTVLIPGGRDVRATLDTAVSAGSTDRGDREGQEDREDRKGQEDREDRTDASDASGRGDAVVVACPPHPRHGGSRHDGRLTAVSEALTGRGVDCLRFDYGPWDEGRGERTDARNALRWAADRYARVGLFGYSFGATVALLVAAGTTADLPAATSVLAPSSRLDGLDAVDALDDIAGPVQVVYGARDGTVDWEPVVERARETGRDVVELSADHFFVGQGVAVGRTVAGFLVPRLRD